MSLPHSAAAGALWSSSGSGEGTRSTKTLPLGVAGRGWLSDGVGQGRGGQGRAGEGQDELEAPWYPAGLSGHQDRCLTPALALCVSSLWATSNLGLHAMPVWPRDDPAAPGAVVAVSESLKTLGHTQLGSGL